MHKAEREERKMGAGKRSNTINRMNALGIGRRRRRERDF